MAFSRRSSSCPHLFTCPSHCPKAATLTWGFASSPEHFAHLNTMFPVLCLADKCPHANTWADASTRRFFFCLSCSCPAAWRSLSLHLSRGQILALCAPSADRPLHNTSSQIMTNRDKFHGLASGWGAEDRPSRRRLLPPANSGCRGGRTCSVIRRKISANLPLNEGLIPRAGACQLLVNSLQDPRSLF